MDPEHAYPFCAPTDSNNPDGGCWQLTLAVVRPLNILYFDGSSGANMQDGSLDSQDLLTWGEVLPERWLDERIRIEALCEWGKQFGLDGYLRYAALMISWNIVIILFVYRMEMDL
jgi:hypothetical protein